MAGGPGSGPQQAERTDFVNKKPIVLRTDSGGGYLSTETGDAGDEERLILVELTGI